jgi:hypothetical protein
VQLLTLRKFHAPPYQRRITELNVRIQKQDVRSIRLRRAQIPPDGGHSSANHAHVQAVPEAEYDLTRFIGRVRISD